MVVDCQDQILRVNIGRGIRIMTDGRESPAAELGLSCSRCCHRHCEWQGSMIASRQATRSVDRGEILSADAHLVNKE